jgi:hypothetical protein
MEQRAARPRQGGGVKPGPRSAADYEEDRRREALRLAVECMKPHITPGAPARVVECATAFEKYLRGDAS